VATIKHLEQEPSCWLYTTCDAEHRTNNWYKQSYKSSQGGPIMVGTDQKRIKIGYILSKRNLNELLTEDGL